MNKAILPYLVLSAMDEPIILERSFGAYPNRAYSPPSTSSRQIRKSELTKKQSLSRSKNKRAKNARKKNRR